MLAGGKKKEGKKKGEEVEGHFQEQFENFAIDGSSPPAVRSWKK